jgi:hypothetical protein
MGSYMKLLFSKHHGDKKNLTDRWAFLEVVVQGLKLR